MNHTRRRSAAAAALIIPLFATFLSPLSAQEPAPLITYGRAAGSGEGDDDFRQIIFISVPATLQDSLFIRLFDADCGGEGDALYGDVWDSRTRFSLFGGVGARSPEGLDLPNPADEAVYGGERLATAEFGADPYRDGQWHIFAAISPAQGEPRGGRVHFKLVVEGVSGNDGNTFLVDASLQPRRNLIPDGLEISCVSPTVRLPASGVEAELRIAVPAAARRIRVFNFDAAGAQLSFETLYRTGIVVPVSGQDGWADGWVDLEPDETAADVGMRFNGGAEMPNDATFYFTDERGRIIPVELPIGLWPPNTRPVAGLRWELLSDCATVLFDGSSSRDEDGDDLTFLWEFGDGASARGQRVTHIYPAPGEYQARLTVTDGSGRVAAAARQMFTVAVNHPPVADAGPDIVAAPGEYIPFDGRASSDEDGTITDYYWDFGDGGRARGIQARHRYKRPDTYLVILRVQDNSPGPCGTDEDELTVWVNAAPVVDIGGDIIASVGEPVNFTGRGAVDSDGRIAEYHWDFGDGSRAASEPHPSHAYIQPGAYTVTLTVTDDAGVGNSTAQDRLTVFVNDPPQADAGPDHRAAAGETIHFDGRASVDRDGQINDYRWNFGDGTVADGARTKHSFDRPGRYWITLTVTDNSGSRTDTATDSALAIINDPPVAAAGPDRKVTDSQVRFDGSASFDADGVITRWEWDFGDGSLGEGEEVAHVYGAPGVYRVRLKVTDDSRTSSAAAETELTVLVNAAPAADAGPDRRTAPGVPVTFDGGGAIDPDGEVSLFRWNFGDGEAASGRTVTHSYERPGRYTVQLTVGDESGHESAVGFDECIVEVNHAPIAAAGPDLHIAPGREVTLDGGKSFDPDGRIVTWIWTFDDLKEPIYAATASRSWDRPGLYRAVLTVLDDSRTGNGSAFDDVIVRVNHRPDAVVGGDIHTCALTVSFDGGASTDADGDPLKFNWDFGDGSPPGVGSAVEHTYQKGGSYPVILTVDDGTGLANGTDIAALTVRINQPPQANAGDDRTVCAGDVVLFSGGGSRDPEDGLLRYLWDFGDGETAEGLGPTKIYRSGGVYSVTLQVVDDSGLRGCDRSVDRIVVWVAESPVAEAGPDVRVCAGQPVQFDGSRSTDVDGVVNGYRWDFGDGASGGGPNPTHIYTQPGVYRVILTITGDRIGECDNTNSDELIVTVYEAPTARFEAPVRAAVFAPVHFDAGASTGGGGNIVKYAWDFGDINFGAGVAPIHSYAAAGRYFVTLTITTDSETECNVTSTRQAIVINAGPDAHISGDSLLGAGQETIFGAASSRDPDGVIADYHWDFGDGGTGEGMEVRHKYARPGQYAVVLRVTDDTDLPNNSDYDTLMVQVNFPPNPAAAFPAVVCVGREAVFDAGASFDPDGGALEYRWTFGDGVSLDGVRVSRSFDRPGRVSVLLTVDDGRGCANSRAQAGGEIIVNAPPVAIAEFDRVVSPGEAVTFDGGASFDPDGKPSGWRWYFPDGDSASGARVNRTFDKPGNYTIRLMVTDDSGVECGVASNEFQIRVNAAPVALAGGDREAFCGGAHDAVQFDAGGSYDPDGEPLEYLWDFGDGSSSTAPVVKHNFLKPGKYKVRLRVRDTSGLKSGEAWSEAVVTVRLH